MKLSLNFGSAVVSLPAATIGYLDKADPLTLKLYLHLAAEAELRESFDAADFAKRFAVTVKEVEAALAFWQNAGLLSAESIETAAKKPAKKTVSVSEKTSENGESVTVVTSDRMPNYTGREIEALFHENPSLQQLVDECQGMAGKMFGAHEINRVIGMADVLRLDHDSILLLFGYAASIGKCSVAYVVKIAQSLVNEGICTYSEVEAYIAAKEQIYSIEKLIRRLGGIGGRAFSAKENRFIAAWSEYGFEEEILTLAYEITVNNTGEFAFPYMNKILVNWHEAGYKTKAEIEDALGSYQKKKEDPKASFDVDEFFEAAIKRTQNRSVKTTQ